MSATLRFGALLLLAWLCDRGLAAPSTWVDRPLRDAIDSLSAEGLRIIYSDELVRADYRVLEEPRGDDPDAILRSMLEPHGLTVEQGPAGSLLIVRDRRTTAAGPVDDGGDRQPLLEEIVVTSSLYNLRYRTPAAHTFLERDLTAALPDLGDEPVRALWRLPGTASGGVSTRHHVRGGQRNEQLFLLDGLRLYEPYHMKDFQQVATIVDQNAIAGIDFYAAGYPVRYGDRMSGVVDIELREPPAERVTELGLSLFNASLLSMGRFGGDGRGDWLLSARRGNLDLIADIVDPNWGSPRYHDLMARVGWEWRERTRVSAAMLHSFDRISLSETDGSESARAKYHNSVVWLKAATDWSDALSSTTLVSVTDIANDRRGTKDVPGLISGVIDARREFRALAFSQQWRWQPDDGLQVTAGADLKHLEASYRYDALRTIAAPFDTIFANEPETATAIDLAPSGQQYAVFAAARWQPFERLVLDAGLRWDQQTYTTARDDEQWSPRLNVLYRLGDATELRFAAGQFYQAQEINELPLSDGIIGYSPAQRASHLVAGVSHRLESGIDLRIEAYRKEYGRLAPRFENAFDALVLIPELQIDRVRIDAEGALARGLELTVSGERSEFLWWASYTWASIEERVDGVTVPRSWDQRHTFKAGVNRDWGPWSFSVAAIVQSGWPATRMTGTTVTTPDGTEELALVVAERNSDRHSPFQSLDVRVSRDFQVPRGDLTAFLEISNLLDRDNPCCVSYRAASDEDGSPRLVQIEGNWLPLVPSLGVQWRF